jgi:hypothetical protein
MHLIRPPHRLRRQMPPARPVPEISPGIATELDLATVTPDETERSVMERILACDRIAWEAAERCAALRREQSALLRVQQGNSEPDAAAQHADLLDGILRAQIDRNRERLECAEQSYRSATQLLRETITDALDRRMAPDCIARRIETLDEAEAGGSAVR